MIRHLKFWIGAKKSDHIARNFQIQRCAYICAIATSIIDLSFSQKGIAQITPLLSTTEFTDKDLERILTNVASARIIALSEATHGKNEPLNFRNALIKALVKRRLIDVVAIESGIIEGRVLYDYVLNETNNIQINSILEQGLSWRFSVIPQNEELVTWLRDYNSDKHDSLKVKLYGFDMPGSPGTPSANRKMNTAFDYALDFLRSADSLSYVQFKHRLEPFFPFLQINFDSPSSSQHQFSQLPVNERLTLSDICWQLVKHFQTHEIVYKRLTAHEDFEWAYLAALNAQHIFNWLNFIPFGYVPPSDDKVLVNSNLFHSIFNYRDSVMYDNFNWIIGREPGTRVFVFASTNHLLKTPILLTDHSSDVQERILFGNYLDSKYRQSYFLISNIVANNTLGALGIENLFLNNHYEHYYTRASYNRVDPDGWQSYYYQTTDTKVDLFKATDIILFDKQQTNIKFR